MNEEAKIPEITEEVRQYFKKHNDERVERQKKIIIDLNSKLAEKDFKITSLTDNIRILKYQRKFPPVDWEKFFCDVLKITVFLVGLKFIIT